jgi:primosomal protein N' (replication factor Y)
MPAIAQVSLPLPLKEPFDYAVPAGLDPRPGCRVRVPLGKRSAMGVVVGLLKESQVKGLKPLQAVLDETPVISAPLLKFTRWIADYYLCGWGEALALALPPMVEMRRETWLEVADAAALKNLLDGLKPRQLRSRAVLERILKQSAMPLSEAKDEGLSPTLLKQALAGALAQVKRDPPEPILPAAIERPILTPAQESAAAALNAGLARGKAEAFLLRGVTGSGKTEVYLEALDQALKLGGGAIVLVPEIALTPQTWRRFEARFPGEVAVLHSGLTPQERARGFERLRTGAARVALGPRSALFAPVKDLKLIVVDEESEPSYKQENSPRYHARDAALVRAKMENAVCVLGSATPSFEAYQNAHAGKLALLELPDRAGGGRMPDIRFIDLYGWDKQGSAPDDALAPELVQALRENLARGEQSLVFLNRRGFAPVWSCAACGQAVECTQCSISMTLHRGQGGEWLRCHLCGRTHKPPQKCPNPKCGLPLLRALGAGTQRLEEELKRLMPQARIQRVDRDSATGAGFHADLGERMREGKLDILLGTQMLAKGLDFPNLTLVGVVNADASLNFPDFRAGERSFQLLVQVAGRAGRAEKKGRVLIQTRQMEHPCLLAVARQDFDAYFKESIDERRAFAYPPFGRLAALIFRSKDKARALEKADEAARQLNAAIKTHSLNIQVLGPAPSPLILVKGWWRYRLLLKSRSSQALHQLLDPWAYQWKDGASFMAVDLDPVSFL